MIRRWWRARQRRRQCWHHDRHTGTSWIDDQLINTGMGKMFWCSERLGGCGRTWFA
jgi:hypothetical protein